MMHKHNPFVFSFKHGIEMVSQNGVADIRMMIRAEGTPDPRRYKAPTTPEVGYHAWRYTEHQASRDIVLDARKGQNNLDNPRLYSIVKRCIVYGS